MAEIVSQELAVRVAVLDVAETGTFILKADSPGRLYEQKTVEEVKTILGVGDEFSGEVPFVPRNEPVVNARGTMYYKAEDEHIWVVLPD